MVDQPVSLEGFSGEVHDALVRLLAGELAAARLRALAAGADGRRIAEILEARRREIRSATEIDSEEAA
jgi:hypothetical protein